MQTQESREIKIVKQPNVRETMRTMEVGEYFITIAMQYNTVHQYAASFKLGGKQFKITPIDNKKIRVERIVPKEEQEN